MLEELRIRGLGVIADATLELAPGLTVVTGETGAGKTMVVAGLGLLFGGRADAGWIRRGADRAVVEGRLRPGVDSPALRRALAAGAQSDEDGTLLLIRTVASEGRSRAHAGGAAVPVGLLAELADDLLTVHGQSDQLRLLRPAEQRAALDRYAGDEVASLRARCAQAGEAWQAALVDLAERESHARERAQEADLLRHGLAEIDAIGPQPDEDVSLRAEAQRLDHADALRVAATTAHAALVGDPLCDDADVAALLGRAGAALEAVAGHDDALAAQAARLRETGYVVADVAGELTTYAQDLEADPARLAAVHERRALLAGLTRKYADTVDGVLRWADRARERLADLDTSDERVAGLRASRDRLADQVAGLASQLRAARRQAADRFAAAVRGELADLAMPQARLVVIVAPRPAARGSPVLEVDGEPAAVGPDGADEVEIQLGAHPGAPLRPVQRAASGGELSRVMLAVEVVFAGADGVPTMVFDEVDAGVGGRAAVEVGRRLARLAGGHQVLVVTHLPQVAAYADRHLVVTKNASGAVTTSGVRAVQGEQRLRELARMLAGLEESDVGLAHAQELLATATAHRQDADPSAASSGPVGVSPGAAQRSGERLSAR